MNVLEMAHVLKVYRSRLGKLHSKLFSPQPSSKEDRDKDYEIYSKLSNDIEKMERYYNKEVDDIANSMINKIKEEEFKLMHKL